MAWRNLWRNSRRSILTMLAIALAGGVVVFFRALQVSAWETSINTSLSLFQGYLQVQAEGYREKGRMEQSFSATPETITRIETVVGVKGVSARALAFALLSSGDRTYGASIIGVLPDRESVVSTIPGLIRRGRYLGNASAEELVIGSSLAKNLHLEVGDELTILGQGRDGSIAATVIPVVGIFESGALDLDRTMVQMPLESFQELFSMNGELHSLVISGYQVSDIPGLEKQIRPLVEQAHSSTKLVVLNWEQLLPGLKQAIELDLSAAWLFYFSLILIVSLSILNTFLMSVVERTREFGVMLALGAAPVRLAIAVLTESALLVVLGLGVGMGIGCVVVVYYGHYGFAVPGSDEVTKMWNLPQAIKPVLSWAAVSSGPAFILGGGLLAALYPAMRATRVEVVRALKQ